MASWTGLDFFIFLILLLNMVLGMARGANREIISMMCLCAAIVVMIKFTVPLTIFINKSPLTHDVVSASVVQNFMTAVGMPALTVETLMQVSYCISLLICFIGVFSLLDAVLSYTGVVEMYSFPYAYLNRKIGGGLGFIRGFIITLIFLIVMQHLYSGQGSVSGYFVNLFSGTAQQLDSLIMSQQVERYHEILRPKNFNAEQLLKDLNAPTQ